MKKYKNTILFGDSIFFGIGASHRNKGCGRLLKNDYKGKVLIKSRPNETSKEAIERLDKDVLDHRDYSIVIILFGNNDCRLDDSQNPLVKLEDFKKNLIYIIVNIKRDGKIPILCNLQPIDSDSFFTAYGKDKYVNFPYSPSSWHGKYSSVCDSIAAEQNIPLVDIRKSLKQYSKSILSKDGLHPNDRGHMIIKDILVENLNKIG